MKESVYDVSDRALKTELDRCLTCREKPCMYACPAGVSAADFIQAARGMKASDILRSAGLIRAQNPLGSTCGAVCSENHCVSACTQCALGSPISIPQLQSAILRRASAQAEPVLRKKTAVSGKTAAVIGAGPAGLSAAAFLADRGVDVSVYEKEPTAGGACRYIDGGRLDPLDLRADIDFIQSLGVKFHYNQTPDVQELLKTVDGVLVASGRSRCVTGGIDGAEMAVSYLEYLRGDFPQRSVAVAGGGAVAMDCVRRALRAGAEKIHIFCLEELYELPLEREDRDFLFSVPAELHLRSSIRKIRKTAGGFAVEVCAMRPKADGPFRPDNMEAVPGKAVVIGDLDLVVLAMGAQADVSADERVVYAGECSGGPSTVVEAVASGKTAAGRLLGMLQISETIDAASGLTCIEKYPMSLACEILGYPVKNPFILSASPMSDGYERVKLAYEAGWGGAILKTAFHNIPVKTPAEYMYCADPLSYANCDSVSARTLEQLCADIRRLRAEYPDRLTMASTGTEVTADPAENRKRWQYNTKELEEAGAMGIEYSLSCPGTDGTDSLALNQDLHRTLEVVDWILSCGDPQVIKLFKLSASVPAIEPFIDGIREISEKYNNAKVMITIGDTLPNIIFQDRGKPHWEDGVIMGMGGRRIFSMNAFSVIKAVGRGIPVSASGGITSYQDAANYLAVGAGFVQFCSMPMRYGYGVIDELISGIGHLMYRRGIESIDHLRGIAGPDAVIPFDKLSEIKRIPQVIPELCAHCGNCRCCPAQAIRLDGNGLPVVDPVRCIGCSFCTQICFIGALGMRERTEDEKTFEMLYLQRSK